MVEINGVKISDVGYYINLDKRTDRKDLLETQLNEFNIKGVERHSANTSTTSGPENCKRSHYELYKKFLDSNNNTLLVLEDDCFFLDVFKTDYTEILTNIYNTDWDLFWLGCRNRRDPIFYKNDCFKTSSVSHAHSYLIKRNFAEHIVSTYSFEDFRTTAIDELLCLSIYGKEVTENPNKFRFYSLDQPLNVLPTIFNSLCYKYSLTTQYKSYSDLWNMDVDYFKYITSSYPQI